MMAKLHFLIINGLFQPLSKASCRDFLLKGRYRLEAAIDLWLKVLLCVFIEIGIRQNIDEVSGARANGVRLVRRSTSVGTG